MAAFMSMGCQVRAASSPAKQPALAMKALPKPVSSAGQPKNFTVPAVPVAWSHSFRISAAPAAPAPRALWPQPCPHFWPGMGRGSATPASWLRFGRASYSPRMPMTGAPWPQVASSAVGRPPVPVWTAKPSPRSTCAIRALLSVSL